MIKAILVMQAVNYFLAASGNGFANIADVHNTTEEITTVTSDEHILVYSAELNRNLSNVHNTESSSLITDKFMNTDRSSNLTSHSYKVISKINKTTGSHGENSHPNSGVELESILNGNLVLRYLLVEPVNCSLCFESAVCYELKHSRSSPDQFMENLERLNIIHNEFSIDVRKEIIELNDMENILFNLYSEMICATSISVCTLDEKEMSHAMNLSAKYVEGRSVFIAKITDLIKFINDRNHIENKNLDLFNSDMANPYMAFPEIVIYEKNLNFSKNITELLELLYSVSHQDEDIERGKKFMNIIADHTKMYPDISLLKTIVKILRHLEVVHKNSVMKIRLFDFIIRSNNMLANIFNTSATLNLMDLEKCTRKLINITIETDMWSLDLDSKKSVTVLYENVELILLGVFFLIGFVGNGLLLFIFLRHSELRTSSNIMLLNLAIADLVFLIVNIPIFYQKDSLFNDVQCKMYHYCRTMAIAVCIYSSVMIGFQRFVALSVFFRRGEYMNNKSKWGLVAVVWIIGGLVAIPYGVFSGVEHGGSCYDVKYREVVYREGTCLFDIILLCIIPVCLMTLFYGLTVDALGPEAYYEGIKIKNQQLALKSEIAVGLFVVLSLSYLPYYMFRFAFVWSDTKVDILYYEHILFFMPFVVYINPCLNPIALYISSRKYRIYFNLYILCGREEASVHIRSKTLETISKSTMVSSL